MNVVVNATVTTDQEENLNVKAQLKVNIFYLNNSIIFVLRCSKVLGLFCICRYCALLMYNIQAMEMVYYELRESIVPP